MAASTTPAATASTEPSPHRDLPGMAPDAPRTPSPAESLAPDHADGQQHHDEEQGADSSTYGFGTPAQGFGQRSNNAGPGNVNAGDGRPRKN